MLNKTLPKSENNFIVTKVGIIVDGQNGIGFDVIEWQESIVQRVLFSLNDNNIDTDIGPLDAGRRRRRRIPNNNNLVHVRQTLESKQNVSFCKTITNNNLP